MTTMLLTSAASLPVSALLTLALRRRYRCGRAACAGYCALLIYLAAMFAAEWTLPKAGRLPGLSGVRLREVSAPPDARGIVGNLLLLTPVSLLTTLLLPQHRRLLTQLLLALSLSLLIECVQVLLRRTSLYDPLLNLSGAALGCGLAHRLRRLRPAACARLEVRGSQCLLISCVLCALALFIAVSVGALALLGKE